MGLATTHDGLAGLRALPGYGDIRIVFDATSAGAHRRHSEALIADGKRVIDRASFQAFGCQTAIAVASMATELLKGKTADEARHLTAQDLSGDLGALPPMKIHCGQLVEGALRNALDNSAPAGGPDPAMAPTLAADLHRKPAGTIRIIPIE